MNAPRSPYWLSFLILPLIACSGSPGGSGIPGEPNLNEGEFSQNSFTFVDSHSNEFQPLGKDVFTLCHDEVATIFSQHSSGASWVRDDASQAYNTTTSFGPGALSNQFIYGTALAGDVDGDLVPELVVDALTVGAAPFERHVQVFEPASIGGPYQMTAQFDYPEPTGGIGKTHLEVGDVDGDGRDEFVVTTVNSPQGGTVRIYEDLFEGAPGTVIHSLEFPAADDMTTALGQYDDDAALELAIFHGNGIVASVLVLDNGSNNYDPISSSIFLDTNVDTIELVSGNFDGLPGDELAVVRINNFGGVPTAHLTFYGGARDNFLALSGLVPVVPPDSRIVSADLDGNGEDEVCWLTEHRLGPNSEPHFYMERYPLGPDAGGVALFTPNLAFAGHSSIHGMDLTVVDDDGNGRKEIVVAANVEEDGVEKQKVYRVSRDSNGFVVAETERPSAGLGAAPVIAGGDFDGETVKVRYTGFKQLHLPDPLPMIVFEAPPTKSGISQNYDNSDVSYGTSSGAGSSYGVTMGTSMSLSIGVTTGDLFGAFEASATHTISSEMEKSLGSSMNLTTTSAFTGSFDHDYIVFQGTLHMVYEYQILAALNQNAVGTIMTLNVPVGTKIFKWTREFYENTVVGGAGEINWPDVFQHDAGDPSSYPTQVEADNLLVTHAGWKSNTITVGQGTGTQEASIEVANEVTSGDSVTYSTENSIDVKVGGITAGASYGVSESYIYEVTISNATVYSATIGDIACPDAACNDYFDWAYDTGFIAYTRQVPGELPFQVIRFWTNPWGGGY